MKQNSKDNKNHIEATLKNIKHKSIEIRKKSTNTHKSPVRLLLSNKELFYLLSDLGAGAILGFACYRIFFNNGIKALLTIMSFGMLGGLYSYIKQLIIKHNKKLK